MSSAALIRMLVLALCLSGMSLVVPGGNGAAHAQATQISLGESMQLSGRRLEVTADELEVDQESGLTTFSGDVLAVQGALRLSATRMQIEYAPPTETGQRRIRVLQAWGDVTLVTEREAVEAQEATYSLIDQTLDMRGGVVFVQGSNVLSGERFTADLNAGTGRMQGRVRTIIEMD